VFEASGWQRIDVVLGDFKLHLSKSGGSVTRPSLSTSPAAVPRGALAPNARAMLAEPAHLRAPVRRRAEIGAAHLGTFRRSAASGAPPLVNARERVTADTPVCALEVLDARLIQRAGVDGVICEVCAADGALVEAGDVLFTVEPQR
jgi:biotin carboxyl carrier protein